MKILLFALFLLIAQNSKCTPIDKQGVILQSVFTTLVCIDWAQTKKFRHRGGEETNPILGKYPSEERVDTLIASALISHAVISYLLPKKLRYIWQTVLIRSEIDAVNHNFHIRTQKESTYTLNIKFVTHF